MNNSLDFIGDVHGHCDELRILLQKLGYVESVGAFRYPGGERSVVFLGDYVDRGPKVRETLNLVRAMRDAGTAIALMGNHEFNMLSFWQKNGAHAGISCIVLKTVSYANIPLTRWRFTQERSRVLWGVSRNFWMLSNL